ncbi:MAG: hypothetical protein ABIK09_00830 [Pseudomonadota bacterium]
MKKLLTVLSALFLLTAGGAAFAAGDDAVPKKGDARVQYLDLGTLVIDGTLRSPEIQFHDQRERVKFERLMRIRKTFMPALMASGTDAVFK